MAKQRPQPKSKGQSAGTTARAGRTGKAPVAAGPGRRTATATGTPARRSTYVEAVALYERGLEALQRHDYGKAEALLESVLRHYPEEKELHERVRLYLNICQRQARPEERRRRPSTSGCTPRRSPSTAAATTRRSRICAWCATRTRTTTTRSTCWPSRTRSAANTPKRSPTSSAPSRSTPRTARCASRDPDLEPLRERRGVPGSARHASSTAFRQATAAGRQSRHARSGR